MFVCKVLFFCTFHLSSFLPPFRPSPLAQCPINHHPHCTSPFTTPHHTAQRHTHTSQRCTTSAYPFGFGQCCRYAPHLNAPTDHLQRHSPQLHHNSPQHCTQSHNVVKSGLNLVISTIHTSHNVVQSEITHYILYTFLF